jgi:glutathione S-transferase
MIYDQILGKHYAEGSLMPLVVSIYVNTLIPAQAPFFLRPLLSPVLNGLINMFLKPDLQRHIDVVRISTRPYP